ALGSILNGSKEEVVEKEKYFQDLVSTAMEKSAPENGATGTLGSGAGGSGNIAAGKMAFPELSFHLQLRALIVKGTAAQHQIILQIMKALRENDAHRAPSSAAPGMYPRAAQPLCHPSLQPHFQRSRCDSSWSKRSQPSQRRFRSRKRSPLAMCRR